MSRSKAERALEQAAKEYVAALDSKAPGGMALDFARIKLYAKARNFADAREEEDDV